MERNNISTQILKELKSLKFPEDYSEDKPEVSGCTIDGAESKDLDDGIDLKRNGKNYLLQVSIANVPVLVKPDSEIFREALRKIETRYYSGWNESMLPKALSDSKLSLLPRTQKAAITFEIELSSQADILDFKFYESVFTNTRRLCYGDFDTIIRALKSDQDYNKFREMASLAELLLEKRKNTGALAIYDLKKGIYTNEEGNILPLNEGRAHIGNIVVQEFMILTNKALAVFCAENNIPLLYRNHTVRMNAPDRQQILEQINLALVNSKFLNSLRERSKLWFNKATYGLALQGHYGLNEPAYTHVTSPIRRIADLINQFVLKDFLHQGKPSFEIDLLHEMANDINNKNTAIMEEKAKYMKETAFFASKIKLNYSTEEQLVKMQTSDFAPVLKAAVKENVLLPELESALKKRFESKNIDMNILYILLFKTDKKSVEWFPIKKCALRYIKETQGAAVQLLNILQQKDVIDRYDFEYNNQSDGFNAKVILNIKDKTVENSQFIYSKRKKDAAHLCAADILIEILDFPETEIIEIKDSNCCNDSCETVINDSNFSIETDDSIANKEQNILPDEIISDEKTIYDLKKYFENGEYAMTIDNDEEIPVQPQIISDNTKDSVKEENYVGRLLELCAKNEDWSDPVFNFEISGPHHQPVIKCICNLVVSSETILVEILSNNKKRAKQDAAKKILEKINESGIIIEEKTIVKNTDSKNYIGLLQEFCVKSNLQLPQYEYKQIGSVHEPVFECNINLYYSGKRLSFSSHGLNKKKSKQNAAENCYKYLVGDSQ